jgi:hypothetical protein
MWLPGNLKSMTLGDLLGLLHRSCCSGTLELIEGKGSSLGRSHQVSLSSGLVDRVETQLPVQRLGDILVAQGFVSRTLLERIGREHERRPESRFGQLLLRERAVTRTVLAAAPRVQMRRKLDSLFALDDVRIRFRVPRPGAADETIPLSPREFLHGRPRFRLRQHVFRRTEERDPVRLQALGVLGLTAGAAPDEIRRAFRQLALSNHPDRFPNASASDRRALIQRFAEISAAYHKLSR